MTKASHHSIQCEIDERAWRKLLASQPSPPRRISQARLIALTSGERGVLLGLALLMLAGTLLWGRESWAALGAGDTLAATGWLALAGLSAALAALGALGPAISARRWGAQLRDGQLALLTLREVRYLRDVGIGRITKRELLVQADLRDRRGVRPAELRLLTPSGELHLPAPGDELVALLTPDFAEVWVILGRSSPKRSAEIRRHLSGGRR